MNDNRTLFHIAWCFVLGLIAVVAALGTHDVVAFTTAAVLFPLPALIASVLTKPRAAVAS